MLTGAPAKQHTNPQPFFVCIHADYFSRKSRNPKGRTSTLFPELEKLAIASKAFWDCVMADGPGL
jgi:hypothetical protein